MNHAHVKQDRPDLMADPLRAMFTPNVSTEVPWWYRIWLWTLQYHWPYVAFSRPSMLRSNKARIASRAGLKRLFKRKAKNALWLILAIAAGILVVWIALISPEAFQ